MKKIIYLFGVLFLAIVVIINILFNANLNSSEQISISWNSIFYIVGLAVVGIALYIFTKILDKHLEGDELKKKRKIIFIVALVLYTLFNIIWIITVRPGVGADQIHVCNLAQTFYRGDVNEFLPNLTYAGIPLREYIQAYHQQISLAFVFHLFFRIMHFDIIESLRILSVIGNVGIIFALYKINKQLSKQYKTNKVLLFTLILTFISLPILSTFIYGDIPSIALCLFSVYFMMKYTESKQWKYAIIAAVLTMIAYMMRMNSLIFIIATVMYLSLHLYKEIRNKNTWKENGIRLLIIIAYIAISILPSSLVKSYYMNKYDLDSSKTYPNVSYFYMAMEEGPRANGWYKEEIGEYALRNPEAAKEEYPEKIKERLTYFLQNPGYMFDFYTKKITSMWAENTYSAICNNITKENDPIENISSPLGFYQKALLLITCICSSIVMVQNRKKLSLEVLFLITIFIGGFAFHILWEAKSRYIIPYIIVLIPVASIAIQKWKDNKEIKEGY